MSDTTTPSAAEVMDLRGRHQYGRSGFCDWCDTPESVAMIDECPDAPTPTPTPDDMLAWLREQSYDVDVTGRRTHLAGDYLAGRGHVTVTLTAFRCDPESYTAPTLHAALEAAVLAVGKATDA